MKMKQDARVIPVAAILFFTVAYVEASCGETLYDVSFQGSGYTVDSYIPTAYRGGPTPRSRVTTVNFGQQMVRSSFGPLTEQPAEFVAMPVGGFQYSQVQMQIDDITSFPRYELSFDAWIGSAAPSSELRAIWDVPDVVTLSLTRDGRVIRNPGFVYESQIGTFDPKAMVNVDWAVDISTNTCQIMINDVLQYSGTFRVGYPAKPDPPSHVRAIRFNFRGQTYGESVGIDNIKVYGIPEPGTMVLLAFGGLMMRSVRKA